MSLLQIDINDQLSAGVRYVTDRLDGPGRVELGQAMGAEVQLAVVAHLRGLAATRHGTANRLGASPTNYLAQAVDAAGASSVLTAESGAATLSFAHPTIARAFRDIHIAPKKGKFLTIPVNAIAYGRRVGEFPKEQVIFNPDPTKPIPAGMAAYVLVRSVTQKRDPSLMPSDREIAEAAAHGAREYVRQTLSSAHLSN